MMRECQEAAMKYPNRPSSKDLKKGQYSVSSNCQKQLGQNINQDNIGNR